jgi:hypothetical protein
MEEKAKLANQLCKLLAISNDPFTDQPVQEIRSGPSGCDSSVVFTTVLRCGQHPYTQKYL